MKRPVAGFIEPAELAVWVDLEKDQVVLAGEKVETSVMKAQSLHVGVDLHADRRRQGPRTPFISIAIDQCAPIFHAELSARLSHLETKTVSIHIKDCGVTLALTDFLCQPRESGRKPLGVHRLYENIMVAIRSNRFGDEALDHAFAGWPAEAPPDRPIRNQEELLGDAHLRKPADATRCRWLGEAQAPSRSGPFGDFPDDGMQLCLGGDAILRRAAAPCRCVLQRRTTPKACRDIVRDNRPSGRIGHSEARRRPRQSVIEPEINIEAEDWLPSFGAKMDQDVRRHV